MLGLVEPQLSDVAAIGTAVHAGIEATLKGQGPKAADAIEASLDAAWDSDTLKITEVADMAEAVKVSWRIYTRWRAEILPELAGLEIIDVERRFTLPVIDDTARSIRIQGTYDMLDNLGRIWDWKTGNRDVAGREAWKYRRGYASVQHVLYPWAAEIIRRDEDPLEKPGLLWHQFRYCVVPRGGGNATTLDLTVSGDDCRFLLDEIRRICLLIEADLPSWPLGPTDWHCSPKWCPAWSECRGKHHGDNPWQQKK